MWDGPGCGLARVQRRDDETVSGEDAERGLQDAEMGWYGAEGNLTVGECCGEKRERRGNQ